MIIIDGYNLLHASGVFGDARGPLGFEQSRRALLDHLSELLGAEAEQTIVVFDALMFCCGALTTFAVPPVFDGVFLVIASCFIMLFIS